MQEAIVQRTDGESETILRMTPDTKRGFADGVFVENARYVRNNEIVLIIRNEETTTNCSFVRTSDQNYGYIRNDYLCFLRSGFNLGFIGSRLNDIDERFELSVAMLERPIQNAKDKLNVLKHLKSFDKVTILGTQLNYTLVKTQDGCRGYVVTENVLESALVYTKGELAAVGLSKVKDLDDDLSFCKNPPSTSNIQLLPEDNSSAANMVKNGELVAVSNLFEKSALILSSGGSKGFIELSLLRCDRNLVPDTQVPYNWDRLPTGANVGIFPVSRSSVEFQDVVRMIFANPAPHIPPPRLTVQRILRVQNKPMWDGFLARRTTMAGLSKGPNEKWLFHGTAAAAADSIRDKGFLRGFNAGNAFGEGAYFSLDASYCAQERYSPTDRKTGEKCLIVARVLVGDYCLGSPSNAVPSRPRPGATDEGDLCDSTVDNVACPTIFVTYEPDQEYPEYIVFFKVPPDSLWAKRGFKSAVKAVMAANRFRRVLGLGSVSHGTRLADAGGVEASSGATVAGGIDGSPP